MTYQTKYIRLIILICILTGVSVYDTIQRNRIQSSLEQQINNKDNTIETLRYQLKMCKFLYKKGK